MDSQLSSTQGTVVSGTMSHSPLIRAMKLGRAIRNQDREAMALGFHALAAEPGARNSEEIGGLAQLGVHLLDDCQLKGRELISEETDFLALLSRKIVGLLEALDGEQDNINLPAWRERLAAFCPVESPQAAPAAMTDHAVGEEGAGQPTEGLAILNQDLNDIFIEEFRHQLIMLEELLETLQERAPSDQMAEKLREDIDECVHTLSGNCRNLRFEEMAACAEAGLAGLQNAQSEVEFQSVYAQFQNSLSLLRVALHEIAANGTYSPTLAAKMASVDCLHDHLLSKSDDEPPIVHSSVAEIASELGSGPVDTVEQDIDNDIRQVFLDETRGIVKHLGQVLQHWRHRGPDEQSRSMMRRELHSLKGAVTAAGLDEMSHFVHRVETLYSNLHIQDYHQREELPALLEEIHETLNTVFGSQKLEQTPRLPDLQRRIADYLSTDSTAGLEDEFRSALEGMAGSWRAWMSGPKDSSDGRVRLARTDSQMNLLELTHTSGELDLVWSQLHNILDATRMNLELLRINRESIVEGLQMIKASAVKEASTETQNQENNKHVAGSETPFGDPLSKSFAELPGRLEQLHKVEQELVRHAMELEGVLETQRNLGDRLKSGLKGAQMVPLGDYRPHLRYLVREIAKKAGKEVDLKFEGGNLQIDRQVIESMMSCFGHLVRNAVAHGIETSAERQQAGKVPRGTIGISLSINGSELLVHFSDDGAGLPMDRIVSKAMEHGLLNPFGQVSDAHMLKILTEPGFSTSSTLDLESGRGMGLDIVYQTVRQLGGSMQINQSQGEGVQFLFRLPATLAITPALLVRVGQWCFAFRSHCVERLLRLVRGDILVFGEQRAVDVDGLRVPLVLLHHPLQAAVDRDEPSVSPVVVVRLVNRLVAFEVDEFIDSIDLLGRSPGTQLLSIPEISGVTVLPDARIVLILDPEAFVNRISEDSGMYDMELASGDDEPGRILVVDDSAVVRTVMQKELKQQGIIVDTAVDGLNALEKLEQRPYEIVLIDIEMPRMNGFELLQQLKVYPKERRPATIVITSESGEQYREQAMELGVDGYLTRPFDLTLLSQLIRDTATRKSVG